MAIVLADLKRISALSTILTRTQIWRLVPAKKNVRVRIAQIRYLKYVLRRPRRRQASIFTRTAVSVNNSPLFSSMKHVCILDRARKSTTTNNNKKDNNYLYSKTGAVWSRRSWVLQIRIFHRWKESRKVAYHTGCMCWEGKPPSVSKQIVT